MIRNMQKLGATAALGHGAALVVGMILTFNLMFPLLDAAPEQALTFLAGAQTLVCRWNVVVNWGAAITLVIMLLVLYERLRAGSPALILAATVCGLNRGLPNSLSACRQSGRPELERQVRAMSDERQPGPDPDVTVVYQIRIKGHLGHEWTDWFDGLAITLEEDGVTLLTGAVVDQAALHGLLKKVRDLGIPLVSVNQVPPLEPATQSSGVEHEHP